MKILIDNVEHELDVDLAREAGALTRVHVPVQRIRAGDVFIPTTTSHRKILAIELSYNNKFLFVAVDTEGFALSSFIPLEIREAISQDDALHYINRNKMNFYKNINEEVVKAAK